MEGHILPVSCTLQPANRAGAGGPLELNVGHDGGWWLLPAPLDGTIALGLRSGITPYSILTLTIRG